MSISSFHTHTRLCKHATGVPRDYAREAAAEGCLALGFSDHCPYPDGTWSGSRMAVGEVGKYRELVAEAAAASPFPVRYGFECEWHPRYESWYRDFLLGENGAEFLAYGPHWVEDAGEFFYIPESAESRLLKSYVDLTCGGIASGLYAYVAHPDLLLAGFTRMTDDVRAACVDIVDAAVAAALPLEVNGLGLMRPLIPGDGGMRAPYPVREFWELAASRGARIICNSDAHRPEDVVSSAKNAREFARAIGIEPEDAASVLFPELQGSREPSR